MYSLFILAERLLSNLDPTTDPCEDFYQHACGGWMENNPIPEGRSSFKAHNVRVNEMTSLIVGIIMLITILLSLTRYFKNRVKKNSLLLKLYCISSGCSFYLRYTYFKKIILSSFESLVHNCRYVQ